MMESWWNSVEAVGRLASWLNWIAGAATLIAAVAAIGSLLVNRRADTLKTAVEVALRQRLDAAEAAARLNADEVRRANQAIATADERATLAAAHADAATSRADAANKQAEAAHQIAAEATVAAERLRAAAAPRQLSQASVAVLTAQLRRASGSKITIHHQLGDTEAARYAEQIIRCFTDAGWRVDQAAAQFVEDDFGVKVAFGDADRPSFAFQVVMSSFHEAKVPVSRDIVRHVNSPPELLIVQIRSRAPLQE